MGRKKKRQKKTNVPILRADGTYEMKVSLGKINDRNIYTKLYAPTNDTLMARYYQWKEKYSFFDLKPESLMPMSEWGEYWLNEIKGPLIAISTKANYGYFIKHYINPYLGDKALIKITTEDIERMAAKLSIMKRLKKSNRKRGLKDSTINEILIVLKQLFNYAIGQGYIVENPYDNVKRIHAAAYVASAYNLDEVKKYLSVVKQDERWSDFFHLEFFSGLRKSEICALKWSDYNEKTGELFVKRIVKYYKGECIVSGTKTRAGKRLIILPQIATEILNKRKENSYSEWVFPKFNDVKLPLDPAGISDKHKQFVKKANIRYIRFHDIRHTFATQSLINGVDIQTLSMIMGHAEPTITLTTYTHNNMDLQRKASEFTCDYAKRILGGLL